MRSEVRPPLTVEETGPQFNHCHISDIWKNVSGSGVWVGWGGSRFGKVGVGVGRVAVGVGRVGVVHGGMGSGREWSGWDGSGQDGSGWDGSGQGRSG